MRILLHICCGPCSIYPLRELIEKDENSVTGFFYNPNIHPYTEMEKRRQVAADYAAKENLEIICGKYNIESFFKNIARNVETPFRCHACWRIRLRETARHAKENGFDAFATTLLVSPYQDYEAIARIGFELGKEFNINFIGKDFRDGFKDAQQRAREHNMYRQKYCGCIFSEKERFSKSR